MPKGEKLRPKQMDQLPLENFENSRARIFWFAKIILKIVELEFFGLPKYSYCKNCLLWGEFMIMEKGGVFGS